MERCRVELGATTRCIGTPRQTAPSSRRISNQFTPPRPKPRRSTVSLNSPVNGRSATRPSYGSGRTRGRNSCRSCAFDGKSGPSFAHQRHRVDQRRAPPRCQRPRSLPDRAGRPEVPVPGDHEPGPHRPGTPALEHRWKAALDAFDCCLSAGPNNNRGRSYSGKVNRRPSTGTWPLMSSAPGRSSRMSSRHSARTATA